VPLPEWRALLTPALVSLFAELHVGVALHTVRDLWHPFHVEPSIGEFENEYGVASRRWAYNTRCFRAAARVRHVVRGEHAGYSDLFAPVYDEGRSRGVLVAGPFATARPTAAQIRARWRALTGSEADVADSGFARYLAATLGTLTLDPGQVRALERTLFCLVSILVGPGDASELTHVVESQRKKLLVARHVERVWSIARMLVEGRAARIWDDDAGAAVGLTRPPEHALVGLLLDRDAAADPLERVLRRDAFQRACVAFAEARGEAVCMPVGDHGVALFIHSPIAGGRPKTALADAAARLSTIAGRHGFLLGAGVSEAKAPGPLSAEYDAAHRAAEKALAEGQGVVRAEPRPTRSTEELRRMRADLGRSLGGRPGLVGPRFDRYAEAVLSHCGHRLEPARAHLEYGLERLIEPFAVGGLLDPKAYSELSASMERASEDARTVAELVSSYRRLASEIESVLERPTQDRLLRGTRRALLFMQQHFAEPLRLAEVARVVGFGPDRFSRLFKRQHGVSFASYLQTMRIEQAKQMLAGTKLTIEQIETLCGFRNRTYFHRLFRATTGTTPSAFRRREPDA
jgi:AraC-like DNA-binding protein